MGSQFLLEAVVARKQSLQLRMFRLGDHATVASSGMMDLEFTSALIENVFWHSQRYVLKPELCPSIVSLAPFDIFDLSVFCLNRRRYPERATAVAVTAHYGYAFRDDAGRVTSWVVPLLDRFEQVCEGV